MVLFEHPGGENTRAALALALDAANKHGLDIVVSTTGGGTVPPLLEMAREAGYSGRIVAVTHALALFIQELGYQVAENHRDISRGG